MGSTDKLKRSFLLQFPLKIADPGRLRAGTRGTRAFRGLWRQLPRQPDGVGQGARTVVVTAGPIPLVAVSEPGVPARYRVTADLAFREVSGKRPGLRHCASPSPRRPAGRHNVDNDGRHAGADGGRAAVVDDDHRREPAGRLRGWRLVAAGLDQRPGVRRRPRRGRFASAVPRRTRSGRGLHRCGGHCRAAQGMRRLRPRGCSIGLAARFSRSATMSIRGAPASCWISVSDPTWGRHRSRMLATPGNHDWEEAAGEPYFSYFGTAAGPGGAGYYSVTLGTWHVVSLNSNIASAPGSAQYEWLKADLARSRADCTLAMWHHPLFSSGLKAIRDRCATSGAC